MTTSQILNLTTLSAQTSWMFHPVMQWRHHSAHEQERKRIFGFAFWQFFNNNCSL